MGLKGKVVVVTGSTRGIGRAIAEHCAKRGAKIVICSRNEEAVNKALAELKNKKYKVSGTVCDVAKPGDLENLLKHAIDNWGSVDIWINNAGLSGGMRFIEEMPPEELEKIVNVNVTGTLYGCQTAIRHFKKRGSGIIFNLNGRGSKGEAAAYTTTYAATKAAVASITKSLAEENKNRNISIHSILPGMVNTDFFKNLKVSTELEGLERNLPIILDAFGTSVERVGEITADAAEQEPGKETGKQYSALTKGNMMRGVFIMMKNSKKMKANQ